MQKNMLKEKARHGTADFPFAIYDVTFEPHYIHLAPLHYHNEFELLLATTGTLLVQTENESFYLSESHGIFINANQLHSITSVDNGKHSFIAIVFDPKLLASPGDLLFTKYFYPILCGKLKIKSILPAEVCQIINELNLCYQFGTLGFEIEIKQQLLGVFRLLIQRATTVKQSDTSTQSIWVKEVLDYIEQNFQNPITLQDLSAHVHISREYLCRIFSQFSQMTPITYLNQYRICKSMELLLETNKTITEIAGLCGFNHCSYFNKLFLQYVGCTPMEYRHRSN